MTDETNKEFERDRLRREKEEHEKMVAHIAQRDQNDADVQEIARQVGVFCRGLDEAKVVHPRNGLKPNEDRKDAIMGFVLSEIGRLRREQNEEKD